MKIVKKLSAEFKIKLSAELRYAFFYLLRLLFNVHIVIEAYLPVFHKKHPFRLIVAKKKNNVNEAAKGFAFPSAKLLHGFLVIFGKKYTLAFFVDFESLWDYIISIGYKEHGVLSAYT